MADSVIVVGIDGTVAGLRALRWALGEAVRRAAAVRVVNAWQFEHGTELAVPDRDSARARALGLVTDAVAATTFESLGDIVPIESAVVEGPVVTVLVAESATAALLVVGHRGRSRLLAALLGSISAECIRHARCPVVVVPPPRPAARVTATSGGAPPPALH
jgi:Universal stress protein UspA and related nucleotide-binding proteins